MILYPGITRGIFLSTEYVWANCLEQIISLGFKISNNKNPGK